MKIKVFQKGLDWAWECDEHDEFCWADCWITAYEGALGHACMHHPAPYKNVTIGELLGFERGEFDSA